MHISLGTRNFAGPSRPLSALLTLPMILHASDATYLNTFRYNLPTRSRFIYELQQANCRAFRRTIFGDFSENAISSTIAKSAMVE